MNYNDYRDTNIVEADFLGNLGDYSLFYCKNEIIKLWHENLIHWKYNHTAPTFFIKDSEYMELIQLMNDYTNAENTDERLDILQYIESNFL